MTQETDNVTGTDSGEPRPFGVRLHASMAERGPLCVGIDPHGALLRDWRLPEDPSGLERFALTVVDALADRVAVLKPQSAFFERFGSRGVAVLERVTARAREAGALVVLDVKRGDIGSTVAAYAQAYLDPGSPLFADAVTASPYLGFGSLDPLYDTAARHGCGVFVLAVTSNPEGGEVQRALGPDGRSVAGTVVAHVAARNAGRQPLGSIGLVMGATQHEAAPGAGPGDLEAANAPVLAPGIGAQGADPAELRAVFGEAVRNVVPSSSRDVLRRGPSVTGLREAAARTLDACRQALG